MRKSVNNLDAMAIRAMRTAVATVVEENLRLGLPLAVWRDGKMQLVSASKVKLPKLVKAKR
jgi:hypothetical protein